MLSLGKTAVFTFRKHTSKAPLSDTIATLGAQVLEPTGYNSEVKQNLQAEHPTLNPKP